LSYPERRVPNRAPPKSMTSTMSVTVAVARLA
jgi:hypothetical protein